MISPAPTIKDPSMNSPSSFFTPLSCASLTITRGSSLDSRPIDEFSNSGDSSRHPSVVEAPTCSSGSDFLIDTTSKIRRQETVFFSTIIQNGPRSKQVH
ncbi:unnamed protein product [Lactuca saligna]|uniref:Uncharacterized protein n=1 Tax=Lactuca saligna TaxID=75948 RepID=A0AA36EQQ2_LACSI|nr:unnamed protein product [Lactuca saligna]